MNETKLTDLLKEVLGDNSSEVVDILEAYGLIVHSAPTVISEAKTHLILLDHSKVKLSSIYYMLSREISKKKRTTQETYDSTYVQLVRRGRPSKDAIEAEIRQLNPTYLGVSQEISDLEEVKDLVSMYIRCIDSSRSSTIEILRNISRID